MIKRRILQIQFDDDEYYKYALLRELLLKTGFTINDYKECGFVICELVLEESEVEELKDIYEES